MSSPSDRFIVNAPWLIQLRWVAVIGQVLTIATVLLGFGIQIDAWGALVTVITLTAISNGVLHFWFKRWISQPVQHRIESGLPRDWILGLVMVMDLLSLTSLLFATGGPNNPFCMFFFVNLSLCAVVLNRRWAWTLNVMSILCFGFLLIDYHQLELLSLGSEMLPIRERGSVSMSQMGLFVSFATCASVIVYFMTRLTGELRKQQMEVRQAQIRQSQSEKIEALGTLAAGTAHELATPLSTIAVVARDVEKALDENPPDFPGAEDVIEDIHLIRSQLDRCRSILDRMAGHAGQSIGESIRSVTVKKLATDILSELPEDSQNRIRLDLPQGLAEEKIEVPLVGLGQAIRGIVQNGLDASRPDQNVHLKIRRTTDNASGSWEWEIRDQGQGMAPEILERVTEPFFTTKPPGKGMGLGVFLAKNIIERIGGNIEYQSQHGVGSCVTIRLP